MNFMIWLIVGVIVGWVASSLMGQRQDLLRNIIVGIGGAFVAGYVLTLYLGMSALNQSNFSLPALLVSLVGAISLLLAVSLFIRRRGFRRGFHLR